MKINLDIDASPQELRAFFGMPDLEPLHQEWLAMVRTRMKQGMENFDPARLFMNTTDQFKAFENLQKAFWQQMHETAKKTEK